MNVTLVGGVSVDTIAESLRGADFNIQHSHQFVSDLFGDIASNTTSYMDTDVIVVLQHAIQTDSRDPFNQVRDLQEVLTVTRINAKLYYVLTDPGLYDRIAKDKDEYLLYENCRIVYKKKIYTKTIKDAVDGLFDDEGLGLIASSVGVDRDGGYEEDLSDDDQGTNYFDDGAIDVDELDASGYDDGYYDEDDYDDNFDDISDDSDIYGDDDGYYYGDDDGYYDDDSDYYGDSEYDEEGYEEEYEGYDDEYEEYEDEYEGYEDEYDGYEDEYGYDEYEEIVEDDYEEEPIIGRFDGFTDRFESEGPEDTGKGGGFLGKLFGGGASGGGGRGGSGPQGSFRGVIAVTGHRQGGCSTTVAGLAEAFASAGSRVLVIDLDIHRRFQSVIYNEIADYESLNERTQYGVFYCLSNIRNLDNLTIPVRDNVDLLGASRKSKYFISPFAERELDDMLTASSINTLLGMSRSKYDVIIVDYPLDIMFEHVITTISIDRFVLCVENDIHKINNLFNLKFGSLMREYDMYLGALLQKSGVVLTRYKDTNIYNGYEMGEEYVEYILNNTIHEGIEVLGRVTESPNFTQIGNVRESISRIDPDAGYEYGVIASGLEV